MGEWIRGPKALRFLLPLGVSAAALLAITRGPIAEESEIDAFQRAVTTQTKADALTFIKDFGSSHLVPDLIGLLQPDVALEVCASLAGGSSRARGACDKVQKAVATAPAAGSSAPAAPPTEEASTTAPSSAAVPPLASQTPPAPTQNQDTVIVPPVFPEPAAGSNIPPDNGSNVALGG